MKPRSYYFHSLKSSYWLSNFDVVAGKANKLRLRPKPRNDGIDRNEVAFARIAGRAAAAVAVEDKLMPAPAWHKRINRLLAL